MAGHEWENWEINAISKAAMYDLLLAIRDDKREAFTKKEVCDIIDKLVDEKFNKP